MQHRFLIQILAVLGLLSTTLHSSYVWSESPLELIDRTKWLNLELVREVTDGQATIAQTRYGSSSSNGLAVNDTAPVSSLEADVKVTAIENAGATARARIAGFFFNDGTPGDGRTGDFYADTEIRHNGTNLIGAFQVWRCTNGDCTSGESIFRDRETFGTVQCGETHRLSLAWDGTSFTFGFDGKMASFTPEPVRVMGNPAWPFGFIGTRVNTDVANKGAHIAASFDNVFVNEARYDTFETGKIEASKWTNLEFVRRVKNGQLEMALTRNEQDGFNSLTHANSASVRSLQADITMTDANSNGAVPFARVAGFFANDGRDGEGHIGDITAQVDIRQSTTGGLVGAYLVRLCNNSNCTEGPFLEFDDTLFGSVNFGEIHTLSLAWNGSMFTFGFDNQRASYTPPPHQVVRAPRLPWKFIGTAVVGIDGPDEGAYIHATFDNVWVNGEAYDNFETGIVSKAISAINMLLLGED